MGHVGAGVARIAVDGYSEEIGAAGGIEPPQEGCQRGLVPGGVDGCQVGANRVQPRRLYGLGVEETPVKDGRFDGGTVGVLQDVPDLTLGVLGEFVEGPEPGAVLGKGVGIDPGPVYIAEEVVLGPDDGRKGCWVQTGPDR